MRCFDVHLARVSIELKSTDTRYSLLPQFATVDRLPGRDKFGDDPVRVEG